MRPEKLSFCGINSFSKPAEIDFSALLSGGIFGIFGDTGSGKTTILDSMIFALYGRADRAKSGGTDIINYNCDKANVSFEFSLEKDGARRYYRAEREIRRKNAAQKLALYEKEEAGWRCVSEGVRNTNERIQELVGLSFEDFKKCIALPQGEFAQFVKAERGERLRLIARLFDLEVYGDKLNAVVRRRQDETKSALDRKEGELSGYAAYTAEELTEMREERAGLSERLQKAEEEYLRSRAAFEKLKGDYTKGKKLAEHRTAQRALERRADEIEKKRADLALLPAAEKIAGLLSERRAAEKELRQCTQRKEKLQEMKSRAAAALSAAEERLRGSDLDGALLGLRARRESLKVLRADIDELGALAKARSRAAADYKRAQAEKADAEREIASLQSSLASFAERIRGSAAGTDLSAFLRENLDSALLESEYADSERYFSQTLQALRGGYPHEGELYRDAERALEERLLHYTHLRASQKQGDAAQLLRAFERAQAEGKALSEQKHAAELRLAQRQGELREAEQRLSLSLQQGQEARAKADAIAEKLRQATGGPAEGGFDKLDAELARQEEELLRQKMEAEEKRASAERELHAAELETTRAEEREENLQKAVQKGEEQIAKLLAETSFPDAAAAESLYMRRDKAALQAEIEAYDRECAAVAAAIAALTAEGEISPVGEEEFAAASARFEAQGRQREELGRQAAVAASRIGQYEAALQQKKALEAEHDTLQQRYAVLEKLRGLLYGNKFMEFVAGEYLAEIADAASDTLLKLTGGRYFVRYEQGFFVGDNFNAGQQRSVNTLSGGETFLVSLSLALALSAAIYAKSLRPIEFFFLDEGFGTLDEKLIDTVMDSLEKLKNRHFSIGLISHVEELKHRIGHKIVVNAAPEGGSSSINICC